MGYGVYRHQSRPKPKRRLLRPPLNNYVLFADAGSYTISAPSASLLVGRKLSANPGSYTVTGASAALLAGRKLVAEPGSYTISGAAASLLAGRKLSADPGVYTLTGANAALLANRKLVAEPGSYIISGANATLYRSGATYILIAEPGNYTLSGMAASLQVGRLLKADPGSYIITGSNAITRYNRVLNAEPGAYILSGAGATLTYSGAVVPFGYYLLELALKDLLEANPTGATNIFIEGMDTELGNLSNMPLINIRIAESNPELIGLPNKYYERIQVSLDVYAFDFTSYRFASKLRTAIVRSIRDTLLANRQFYSLLETTSVGPGVAFGASGIAGRSGHIAMATMIVTCELYMN